LDGENDRLARVRAVLSTALPKSRKKPPRAVVAGNHNSIVIVVTAPEMLDQLRELLPLPFAQKKSG
jgi:hypothetical protein